MVCQSSLPSAPQEDRNERQAVPTVRPPGQMWAPFPVSQMGRWTQRWARTHQRAFDAAWSGHCQGVSALPRLAMPLGPRQVLSARALVCWHGVPTQCPGVGNGVSGCAEAGAECPDTAVGLASELTPSHRGGDRGSGHCGSQVTQTQCHCQATPDPRATKTPRGHQTLKSAGGFPLWAHPIVWDKGLAGAP